MPSWTGDDEVPFDPAATPAAEDLGATADLFWRQPGVVRSDHLQAFAAIGPQAEAVVKTPLPLPPHVPDSPVGRVHDLDGQVLLLGVGHDADTSLHLAELLAKVPYGIPRHCMVMQDGKRVRVDYLENDHCCQRFALADDWLRARGLQVEGPVGHATARLARARDIVGLAVDATAAAAHDFPARSRGRLRRLRRGAPRENSVRFCRHLPVIERYGRAVGGPARPGFVRRAGRSRCRAGRAAWTAVRPR